MILRHVYHCDTANRRHGHIRSRYVSNNTWIFWSLNYYLIFMWSKSVNSSFGKRNRQTDQQHATSSYKAAHSQLALREAQRTIWKDRHLLAPSFPAGTSTVLSFLRGALHDNCCFSLPQPKKVTAWLPALHAHGNIFWSVAQHQPAHKLINPTCLTTTCQALHQRRSVAAVKGQCFSNSRGAEAWTERGGNNSEPRRRCLRWSRLAHAVPYLHYTGIWVWVLSRMLLHEGKHKCFSFPRVLICILTLADLVNVFIYFFIFFFFTVRTLIRMRRSWSILDQTPPAQNNLLD